MTRTATKTPIEQEVTWKYTYKCSFCSRSFGSDSLENHIKIHECPLCFAKKMGWDKKWYKQFK
jgi:DNA-directed RNA polymerase subunit RPC12/RpoP